MCIRDRHYYRIIPPWPAIYFPFSIHVRVQQVIILRTRLCTYVASFPEYTPGTWYGFLFTKYYCTVEETRNATGHRLKIFRCFSRSTKFRTWTTVRAYDIDIFCPSFRSFFSFANDKTRTKKNMGGQQNKQHFHDGVTYS